MLDFWDVMCHWVTGSWCLKGMFCLQLQSYVIKEECSLPWTTQLLKIEAFCLFQNVRSNSPNDSATSWKTWIFNNMAMSTSDLWTEHSLSSSRSFRLGKTYACQHFVSVHSNLCYMWLLFDWEVVNFDSPQGKKFSLLMIIPITSGVHPASCLIAPC